MLRVNPIITNFSAGEMSPWLLGRIDLQEKYLSAAETLTNFMVRPEGGIEYRPGFKYITRSGGTGNIRLVPFVYSRTEALVIEITAGKFRFFRNKTTIDLSGVPYTVTTVYGTATAVPYTSADLPDLQFAQSADVLYITHPSHPPATLSRYGTTDWRYEIITFNYGPFMDQEPGEEDYSLNISSVVDRMTLTSATTDDFLPANYPANTLVEYAYSGQRFLGKVKTNISDESLTVEPLEDYCFSMAPEVYSPGVYTGWDGTNNVPTYSQSFTGSGISVAFSNTGVVLREMINGYLRFVDKAGNAYWMRVTGVGDIPQQVAYGIIATGDILTVKYPSGIVTRSARSVKTVLRSSAANFFDTTRDLGRTYRLVFNGTVLYAKTRAHDAGLSEPANSGSNMAVTLDRAPPLSIDGFTIVDKGTTNEWNRGAWFVGNYPRSVCFHEERLCFLGTEDEPMNGWMSKSADFYNFAPTDNQLRVLDNSAITFTVASSQVNEILWGASHDGELILGTTGGEHVVRPSSTGKPLTATNISVRTLSAYGSDPVQPLHVGRTLLHVQRGGYRLRQMGYHPQFERRVSLDLNAFAEHIFKNTTSCTQVAFQLLPNPVVYCRTGHSTRQMACLSYDEDQNLAAWSTLSLGSVSGGDYIASVASVPYGQGWHTYIAAWRQVLGDSAYQSIEVMDPSTDGTITGNKYFDSWREGSTSFGQTQITGLTDFANATVWCILKNTCIFSGSVDEFGVLTIPAGALTQAGNLAGGTYYIGLAYTGTFKAFPMETQAMAGTGQGKPKRIHRIVLRLYNSYGLKHGDGTTYYQEEFRATGASANSIPAARSEDYAVSFTNGIDTRAQFRIIQEQPLPLAVLSIMPEMAQFQ